MLNQLESLTERVGGSNTLVDRWLHVRKHLLVAYYNLVGLKPGKESFMRLTFMNALSAKWKGQRRI